MTELLLKDEVFAVVGAAMAVYNELRPGFLEAVYHEALEIELTERGIPYESRRDLHIVYKGRTLKKCYEADFVCHQQIVLEIKAIDRLTSNDEAQLLNYLKATRLHVGLLINFGHPDKLEWLRRVK
jgi:GxxExxY protein